MIREQSYRLTLYFFPSPIGINWASPASLLRSAILNRFTLKNRQIGHVAIGLRRPGQDRDEYLTGMTDTEKPYVKMILGQKVGFGVLWTSVSGRLETQQELWTEILEKRGNQRLSLLEILISEETFLRLEQYLLEYRDRNYQVNYGLFNRPRHGEGAGCSAFAASFLDVAGLVFDEFKDNWSYTINFPEEYIGRPVFDKDVNLGSLFSMPNRWAEDSEAHKSLFFWDPDSMHRWATKLDIDQSALDLTESKFGNCRMLHLDCRDQRTPSEPIWQGAAAESQN